MNKPLHKPIKTESNLSRIECSLTPKVSVVIPVNNERNTIVEVIQQASKVHEATEVIVVSNGSTDGTDLLAMKVGAKVLQYKQSFGHDVGRCMGALEAKGDIILFIDGDFVISHLDLRPFIKAIENGAVDVALNTYQGPVNRKNVHSVILAKHALNVSLSRPDLRGSSLTTIPHALSRKALEQIGVENLVVPPLAHAIAIKSGLNVGGAHYVDVGYSNPRKRKAQRPDPIKLLIIGDHLEAIHWLTTTTNQRGAMTDLMRAREMVSGE